MTRKIQIHRYRFSMPEVARAMLGDDIQDCEEWQIRTDHGMVLIDVIEPADAGQQQAPAPEAEAAPRDGMMTLEEALEVLRLVGDEDYAVLIEEEIRKRKEREAPAETAEAANPAEAGGVGSSFAAEVNAAADAEQAASGQDEATDDGSDDPFWDSGDAEGEAAGEGSVKETDPHYWAKIAGIVCNERGFQKMLFASDKDEAAVKLRERCGIKSRRELDSDEAALRKFKDLRTEYAVWLDGG
jgi:hypothetical protein